MSAEQRLRANLSLYDAAHVAFAERTDAPLVTLDSWIAGAPGIDCPVTTPGANGHPSPGTVDT